MTDRTEAHLLSEAWDRLLLGDPDPADPALAPTLVETLRLLHALHQPAQPDTAFKARLRREVMGQPAAPVGKGAASATAPRPWAAADRRRPGPWPVRDALPALAAAALVLALVGGLLGMQRGLLRPAPDDSGRTVAIAPTDPPATPAAIAPATAAGTPVALADPAGVRRESLFAERLADVPANASCLLVERLALGPADSVTTGDFATAYRGPMAYRVESGAVALTATGGTTLTRAGGVPTSLPANQPVGLEPGDALFAPTDTVTHWTNSAGVESRILDAGVVEPNTNYDPASSVGSNPPLLAVCGDLLLPQLGSAPFDLGVERITLAPGALLPRPMHPGLAPLSVQQGTLSLVWADRADPATPLPRVGPRQLAAGTATVELNGPRFVATELRNDGDQPTTFVLMTVRPAAAPPVAAAPVAPAGVAQLGLLRARLDVPANASWLGYEEWTVPAGAAWDQGSPETSGVGPTFAQVEGGTLAVTADGPMVKTAFGQAPATVAPGSPAMLAPGDTLRVPAGVATHWRNDGTGTARLATFGASTIGDGNFNEMVSLSLAEVLSTGGLNGQTADLALREVTLAPGASFAPDAAAGVAKIVVRSGSVTVGWAKRTAPDVATGSLRVDPQSAAVDIESANFVARELRNDGAQPAVFLLFTAQPATVATATPTAAAAAAVATEEVLFRQRLDAIPDTASCPIVEREVLPPGGTMLMGTKATFYLGPMAFRVEAGEFTVVGDGALTLTRAGASTPAGVPSGTMLRLAPGDVLFAPAGVISNWRNDGATHASLVDTGVVDPSMGHGHASDDVQTELLNGCGTFATRDFGGDAADATVRRITLPPGGVLPNPHGRGRAYLGVEAGKVTLDWARPDAPDRVSGTISLRAGGQLEVDQPNVFAREFRNEGTEPAIFLIMALDPVPTAATPQAGG